MALGVGRIEQLKRETATAISAAEARLEAVARFAELAAPLASLEAELAELAAQRQQIEADTRSETGTAFATRLAQLVAAPEAATARLTAHWQAACAEHEKQEAAAAALREQHAEATRKPGLFARLFGKRQPADPGMIETQLREAERLAGELAARVSGLQHEVNAATARLAAEREQLLRDEVAARQAQVDSRLAQVNAECERLRIEVTAIARPLGPNPPGIGDLDAVHTAITSELITARDRATQCDGNPAELLRHLLAEPQVVVGIPGSLGADPVFGSHDPNLGPPFALLILDRAEELTEADFLHLSTLAERWVLVGDVALPPEPKPHRNGIHPRHGPRRNGRIAEVPFATRLAQALDRERLGSRGGATGLPIGPPDAGGAARHDPRAASGSPGNRTAILD